MNRLFFFFFSSDEFNQSMKNVRLHTISPSIFSLPRRKASEYSDTHVKLRHGDNIHFYVNLSARLPSNWSKLYERRSKGYVITNTIIHVAVNANHVNFRESPSFRGGDTGGEIVHENADTWNPRNRYFLVGRRALPR